MGVINNLIAIKGIEANIAGIMTSVADCVEAVANVQTSVRSMGLQIGSIAGRIDVIEDLTVDDVLLSTDTLLQSNTYLTLEKPIENYKIIEIRGYKGTNDSGKRFTLMAYVEGLKGGGYFNLQPIMVSDNAEPYILAISIASDGKPVFNVYHQATPTTFETGFHVTSIKGLKI